MNLPHTTAKCTVYPDILVTGHFPYPNRVGCIARNLVTREHYDSPPKLNTFYSLPISKIYPSVCEPGRELSPSHHRLSPVHSTTQVNLLFAQGFLRLWHHLFQHAAPVPEPPGQCMDLISKSAKVAVSCKANYSYENNHSFLSKTITLTRRKG